MVVVEKVVTNVVTFCDELVTVVDVVTAEQLIVVEFPVCVV